MHRRLLIAPAMLVVACLAQTSPSVGPASPALSPSLPSSPSPSPLTPNPSPVASELLGEAPVGCPGPVLKPKEVADFVGPMRGGTPLWAGFYARYDEDRNAFEVPDAVLTDHGWRVKILFIVEPHQTTPVALVAASGQGAVGQMKVEIVDSAEPMVRVLFDPKLGGTEFDGWGNFPSYAYFPSAGCYSLVMESDRGNWRLGFGFGQGDY
jgi:hypothetical protein